MRNILFTLVLVITFYIGAVDTRPSAAERVFNPATNPKMLGAAPLVRIEATSKLSQKQPLRFRGRIENSGTEPLYVYSALFQNPGFVDVTIDTNQRLIEARFSRVEALPFTPYYFPKAAFWKIDPKQAREFVFVSARPLNAVRSYQLIQGKSKEQRIRPGLWTLRIMIGYGYDMDILKPALAQSAVDGKEHPINAIVRWQDVAYSNSVAVNITN